MDESLSDASAVRLALVRRSSLVARLRARAASSRRPQVGERIGRQACISTDA